ncbi:hypothetical protein E2C01_086691 [Portunus trituberculatus]|uniref:Uncharacterized protein n=1 Tax=Portunus trituberculatus TaxID=210409 RepID=A0A5B7J4H7_PORTR|nr:hypothetical protein [Portunus trituberculatus]
MRGHYWSGEGGGGGGGGDCSDKNQAAPHLTCFITCLDPPCSP